MTQIQCPVVELTKWAPHPNADTLSISHVFGNCVIFRTADILRDADIGQPVRVVYIPEESLLPEDPRWEFMWANRTKEGKPVREVDRVVRAKKLRGIFSCGLIIPVPETVILDDLKFVPHVGHDMAPILGITKYEQPEKVSTGGDNLPCPPWFRRYTDIENAKGPLYRNDGGDDVSCSTCKWLSDKGHERTVCLVPYEPHLNEERKCAWWERPAPLARHTVFEGKNVVISEKTHGSNSRYVYRDNQFWVGSHNNVKDPACSNIWTRAAQEQGLEEICKKHSGWILFGEVYGPVQKGYDYGKKVPTFVLFDILDVDLECGPTWLSWDHVLRFSRETGVPVVPTLYRGPWVSLEHAASFADGPTVLGDGRHNREGCVVKCDPEDFDSCLGRVILKVVGESYLLGKYGK